MAIDVKLKRALHAEMTNHLGCGQQQPKRHDGEEAEGDFGEVELETQQDRSGSSC